jgi:secondary thiamine-phosphate synthase enzyme
MRRYKIKEKQQGRSMIHKINVKTRAKTEFQDITDQVSDAVKESGIEDGLCVVYVPHTTAAVMINEHADPDVVDDIAAQLDRMVPWNGQYKHDEGNSAAHIKAALIGPSKTIIVQYGELALGTWQGIFFCDFDGPRNRTITVKITGDREEEY